MCVCIQPLLPATVNRSLQPARSRNDDDDDDVISMTSQYGVRRPAGRSDSVHVGGRVYVGSRGVGMRLSPALVNRRGRRPGPAHGGLRSTRDVTSGSADQPHFPRPFDRSPRKNVDRRQPLFRPLERSYQPDRAPWRRHLADQYFSNSVKRFGGTPRRRRRVLPALPSDLSSHRPHRSPVTTTGIQPRSIFVVTYRSESDSDSISV